VNDYGVDVRFLVQPSPGLAEQVEQGDFSGSQTRSLVERYVRPLVDQGADTLVLGCTHYPFLRDLIQSVAGAGVELIDPADAVARELRRRLEKAGLLSATGRGGSQRFWTTGPPDQAAAVMSQLLGAPVAVERL
jgi:glutamate racemase